MSVTEVELEDHYLTIQEIEPFGHLISLISFYPLAGSTILRRVPEILVKTVVKVVDPQVHLTELVGVEAVS